MKARSLDTGRNELMQKEGALTNEELAEIFSCTFCKYIQKSIALGSLSPIEECKYLFHLKHVHNLER